MSMYSGIHKMKPILDIEKQHDFKFQIGDKVAVMDGPIMRFYGTIEAQRIMYARRYYDVHCTSAWTKMGKRKSPPFKNRTVIETELDKDES